MMLVAPMMPTSSAARRDEIPSSVAKSTTNANAMKRDTENSRPVTKRMRNGPSDARRRMCAIAGGGASSPGGRAMRSAAIANRTRSTSDNRR